MYGTRVSFNICEMTRKLRHILTIHAFIFMLQGIYEKGTKDEIEEFIYQLSDINGDGTLGRFKH